MKTQIQKKAFPGVFKIVRKWKKDHPTTSLGSKGNEMVSGGPSFSLIWRCLGETATLLQATATNKLPYYKLLPLRGYLRLPGPPQVLIGMKLQVG